MRMLQLNNCIVLRDVFQVNDLVNFHNFFHQLLMHWIIHVVLSLMSRLFHIFSLSMLSFVSTSSMTVFVFPRVRQSQSGMLPVFRFSYPSSTLAHHWLHSCASSNTFIIAFCSHYAVSSSNRSIAGSFYISSTRFQTCNRPTIDLLPDLHDRPIVENGVRPLT